MADSVYKQFDESIDKLSEGDFIIAEGAGLLKEGVEVGPSPTPSPSSPKWEKGNKKRPETKEN